MHQFAAAWTEGSDASALERGAIIYRKKKQGEAEVGTERWYMQQQLKRCDKTTVHRRTFALLERNNGRLL